MDELFKAHQKKWMESLEDFNHAIHLSPDNSHYLYGRSQVYFELANPEEAQNDALLAVRLDNKMKFSPGVQDFFKALLTMYIDQGKNDKALYLHEECKKYLGNINFLKNEE